MANVNPKEGGPYSLFCSDCNCWVPNTANHEMKKEGVYSYTHSCSDGICDMKNSEIKAELKHRRIVIDCSSYKSVQGIAKELSELFESCSITFDDYKKTN